MYLSPLLFTLMAPNVEPSTSERPISAEAADALVFGGASEPAILPLALPAPQDDGGRSYLRVSAGLVTMKDSDGPGEDIEFNEGYLLGLAFGQRMNSNSTFNFNLELEALWTDQDADDSGPIQSVQDVTFGALFLNGVFDFELGERLSLYAGGGVGAAWVDVGTHSSIINDFDSDEGPYLAWQLRAGLEWRFSSAIAGNLGYRFITNDDVELDDDVGGASFDLETQQHVLEVGLRFTL